MEHASAARDPDETLPEAFWQVVRRLRHTSSDSLAAWGITPAQARALRVLSRFGTMRLSELSAHLRIAPRSATEVVDELVSRDLVRRGTDPQDRRAVLVELTDHGGSTSAAVRAAGAADAERVFDRLSAEEQQDLRHILDKLRD